MVTADDRAIARLERRNACWSRRLARLERASRLLAALRLGGVAVALACAWLSTRWTGERGVLLGAALGLGVAVLAAVPVHRRVHARRDLVRDLVAAISRELQRARDAWRDLPFTGWTATASRPDLAADLGLLGPGSLHHAISRCATSLGAQRLAERLTAGEPAPALEQRQGAVLELAAREALRQRVEAAATAARSHLGDGSQRIAAAMAAPSWLDGRAWAGPAASVLVIVTIAQVLAEWLFGVPTAARWCLLAQVVVVAATRRRVTREIEPLLLRESAATSWAGLLHAVGRTRFRAPLLRALHADLGGTAAARELRRLARILDALALRFNAFHLVLDVLLLWDLRASARLARWKREHGARAPRWLEAVATFEELSSLSGHARLAGASDLPRVAEDAEPFSAEGLAHPLLPRDRAVPNDVRLVEGVLLLTGSNMSGKSTLLRAIGANAALALAGGAAQARRLAMRPCRLVTSIAVSDALEESVSKFLAEVRRLKAILDVVDRADDDPAALPALFLVDEILSGTNSRERLIASRSVVARLARSRSAGVVTSHDVSLSRLEPGVPGVVNAHFREDVGEAGMAFDHVLRPGAVTTTNALAILRLEGIDLPDPAPEPQPDA